MKTELLLSRLEKVRKGYAPQTWIACCPAHDDKSPSLAIAEKDGRILIKCFALCDPESIVSAVGMELSDLFPERPKSSKPLRHRWMPQDVIKCLSGETMFLVICAESLSKGEKLPDSDIERLKVAHRRFANAVDVAGI